MFTKESLYINAIKYDTQLKLDYKKLNDGEITEANNSVFLVNDDIMAHDIAHKLNSSQEQTPISFISTLLISDTTKLIKKNTGTKLQDCNIASFNNEFDIAVLKTTLFETKHYFDKTGVDFVYSAFHILNLHLQKNICKNQILVFLFNNRAFLVITDNMGSIVFSKTVDTPTFESVKDTKFYEEDVVGQKLFDEIYYLEINEIIHNNLNEFYEKETNVFIDKVTILYDIKQLTNEQISQLSEDLMLSVDYHPVNIEEEIFELSKDTHQKQSFIKPRKKEKKSHIKTIFILLFFAVLFFGVYKLFINIEEKKQEPIKSKEEIRKEVVLPDHMNKNDKISQRIKAIFNTIPFDLVLRKLIIDGDALELTGTFLSQETYINSLRPELENLYSSIELENLDEKKKVILEAKVKASDAKELENIVYKTNTEAYIIDEFLPISRVSEQLKILLPQNVSVKFKSSNNNDITKFTYAISMVVKTPREFFDLIDTINNELYSINITYPISMIKNKDEIKIDFDLEFNQPK